MGINQCVPLRIRNAKLGQNLHPAGNPTVPLIVAAEKDGARIADAQQFSGRTFEQMPV